MALIRTHVHTVDSPDLPPADFFCSPEILRAGLPNRRSLSAAVALQVIKSMDDVRLAAWARNQGVVIQGMTPHETTNFAWQGIAENYLAQGIWWSKSHDAWLINHPSLLPKAMSHALNFAQGPETWAGFDSPVFKGLQPLFATVAPGALFTENSIKWLSGSPSALKIYLEKPTQEIMPHKEFLWSLWLDIFLTNPETEVALTERLLFIWLTEHTPVPGYILDQLNPSSPFLGSAHASRTAHAAILRTAPTSPQTLDSIDKELAAAKDWRVVVNCFDHPSGSPVLDDTFEKVLDSGALASDILRQPVRALARSRHGHASPAVIKLIMEFFDDHAKRILWDRLPPSIAIALADAFFSGDNNIDEIISLVSASTSQALGAELISSGLLPKWLTHQDKQVRLLAAILIGRQSNATRLNPT